MNEQSISLDLKKNPVPVPVLYLGQGDLNGTTLKVAITDNGSNFNLSGYDVKLCIRQPLHAGYYECDGTSASNVATFVIDETYGATTPGVSDCAYIDIIDEGNVIASTARFQVVVLPNASEGVNPTTAYTNGIVEFLEESEAEFDEKIAEVDAAIEAIGEISVLAVPLMSSDVRGGAKLGSGFALTSGTLNNHYTMSQRVANLGIGTTTWQFANGLYFVAFNNTARFALVGVYIVAVISNSPYVQITPLLAAPNITITGAQGGLITITLTGSGSAGFFVQNISPSPALPTQVP